MREPIACLLCSREFRPSGSGRPNYCARCRDRYDRAVARVRRTECGECGSTFETTSSIVRYCSDACRKRARPRGRSPPRQHGQKGGGGAAAKKKCRVCGKAFVPCWEPGMMRAFCSDECRAERLRARRREAARRYLADPEKRAIHAARLRRAIPARRAGAAKRGKK